MTKKNYPKVLKRWHEMMETGEDSLLDELLAEEVVFHSPVVHTPQRGKKITKIYLGAAAKTLGGEGFEYVREIIGEGHFVLEFMTSLSIWLTSRFFSTSKSISTSTSNHDVDH